MNYAQTDCPVQQMQNMLNHIIFIYTKRLTAETMTGVYICVDGRYGTYCQASFKPDRNS